MEQNIGRHKVLQPFFRLGHDFTLFFTTSWQIFIRNITLLSKIKYDIVNQLENLNRLVEIS